jgi:hypothetical protein
MEMEYHDASQYIEGEIVLSGGLRYYRYVACWFCYQRIRCSHTLKSVTREAAFLHFC